VWIGAEHGVEEQFLRAVGESSEVRLEGEDNDASGTYWTIDAAAVPPSSVACAAKPEMKKSLLWRSGSQSPHRPFA
jgi:hypothetical protein